MKNGICERGVTLFELMVAIGLISILSGIGAANFSSLTLSYRKTDSILQTKEDLRIAQQQSVAEGGRGIFTISADNKSYNFGYDYLPYDLTPPIEPDNIVWQRGLPNSIKVSSTHLVIFNSQGRVVDELGILISPTISFIEDFTGVDNTYATATLATTGVFGLN